MAWIGRKKLAFIPLYRPNVPPPDLPDQIPPDWHNDILRRVLFDPTPGTGADRSLRAYIHAASSGRADLDVVVWKMQVLDQKDVPPDALDEKLGSRLRDEGCDAAALVMLGQPPTGTANRGGFWARFDMSEPLAVWAMELMHCLTSFDDLYVFGGNMEPFEEMASNTSSLAKHPSAYTKAAVGWLDGSAIAQHATGQTATYDLHAIGLVQPPPSGRSAAVRIGSQVQYLMVEARQKVDQFDANIPSQGVIVYRVQTPDPLGHALPGIAPVLLLTTTALKVGGEFTSDTGVRVRVTSALPGGFSVQIDEPVPWMTVSGGRTTPGAPVTAVVTGQGRVALFLADLDGGIYTTSGSGTIWEPWTTVSEGKSTPGAPVAAVAIGQGRVALFLADPDGGIYTTSGSGTVWEPWTTVSDGRSAPGASVTAVVIGHGRVALFLADLDGGIYTTSGSGTIWEPWTTVSEGKSTPGAPVVAVAIGQGRVALFLADPDGGIYTTSGSGTIWEPWTPVSDGRSAPGASVTAVVIGHGRVALFLADLDGGIYTTSGNTTVGWEPWTSVSEGRSTPGAPVTAVAIGQSRVALFLADLNGGTYTTTKLEFS